MKKEIIKILKDLTLKKESYIIFFSTLIILVLMYRSSPYWSSMIRNYIYSTFLFLFLPLLIAAFPEKKRIYNKKILLFWSFLIFTIVISLVFIEIFPKLFTNLFPIYKEGGDPLVGWIFFLIISIPVFIIILIYLKSAKFKLSEFGICIGKWKLWIPVTIIFLIIITPILFFLSKNPEFKSTYPLFKRMIFSNTDFWKIDITWFYYIYIWEFFFRGFILFALVKKVGVVRAIFIQAIIFSFAHLGKPELEVYSSLIGGI